MTGKRPYRLGKRQASVDATRRRILEAASVEYEANGIEDTSMQAVARRAEVAAGTVLYHYPTPEALAEAVVELWIEDMEPPLPEVIDPTEPIEARITKLVLEMHALYARTEHLYRVYQKSPNHPALTRGNEWWEDNTRQLMARALGGDVSDQEDIQVLSVLINPGFRGTLVASGIADQRAAEIAAQMAIDWISR